jgi:hypothetical protein
MCVFSTYVEHLTNHDAILMYLVLLIIASILVPIHHKLKSWAKEKIYKKFG